MPRILLALLLLGAAPAMAVGLLDAAGTSDGLLMMIKTNANQWSNILRGFAMDIFWMLATIQFVWTFGQLALKQPDYSEMIAELIKFIMITGFYLSLLMFSVTWAAAIVDTFRQVAASAAGVPVQLSPGDMFGMAIELGRTIAGIGLVDPVTAFVVSISAILVVACFAFIAAFMMVTLVESYFVINAGVFFMAFGGSQWTREYALAMLRYAVAVGAKLFVLTLIVGLIMTSARSWQMAYTHDETSMLTMAGLALVCAYMSKTLPEMIQGLITGVSAGGGSQLGGMMAAGLAGMAAGAAAMSSMGAGKVLGGMGSSVADLLRSSLTPSPSGGGSGSGGGSPVGGGANYMGMGPGGGSSGAGVSPRTGGGGHSKPPGTPPSAAPTGQSSSSANQASTPSDEQSSSAGAAAAATMAQKLHAAAHTATNAVVRGAGIMGDLAVPGMSGAANVSLPPIPETPSNIIRPESVASEEVASDPVNVAAGPVDTMANLEEALINKGKS